jgi:hypothetical protein
MESKVMSATLELLLGFIINLIVALVIVRGIYYPATHNKPYVFTFLTFNTVIFFVLSFITSIEMSLGVGFGLFAIFTILRYRTDPIPIREMTYLFVIAALPVMNSAGTSAGAWLELALANTAVMAILYVLEKEWGFHYEAFKQITYEKIALIKPENRRLLLADLEERTGLKIKRCVIGKVNFLRDTAEIKIYYDDPDQQSWLHAFDAEVPYATSENFENPTAIS